MIGVTIAIGEGANKIKTLAPKEDWHYSKSIVSNERLSISFTGYNGYPIEYWSYKEFIIIVEGIVFNLQDEELHSRIQEIADKGFKKKTIAEFINIADGDFCIYIVNEKDNSAIAFNDILGGLPLFYSCEANLCFISRQFGVIASNLKDRKWNKNNIAEYLKFGYNLRNRTFSDLVFKLEPASVVKASYSDCLNCNYENLYVDDFSVVDKYKSKKEAVEDLSKLFIESCRMRVNYAEKHGYTIVNTLSGGFDSRTIVGGLEKCTSNYINLTYEYIQDESIIAKQVLKAVGSNSEYVKLNFKNTPDIYNTKLTLNTDGRTNVFTTSICYNDMMSVHNHFGDKRLLYFGGFGGEYIRHPRHETFLPFSKIVQSYTPTYDLISQLCNTNPKCLTSLFANSFSNIHGKRECKYKDLYNEYYENFVRCASEDRTRMFYFTVQPMMGKDFIMAIRHRVPLKWAGFEFYKHFLMAVDKRLVTVDIYDHPSNYLEDKNLRKIDFKKRIIEKYISPIRILYHKINKKGFRVTDTTIDYSDLEVFLNGIKNLNLFNSSFIKSNYSCFNKAFKYKLIAIIIYINEIENLINRTEN